MIKCLVTGIWALLCFCMPVAAQQIMSGEDRAVRIGIDLPLVEPHLAVNPRDSRNLLGGAMAARADGSYACFAVSSGDAGSTWLTHEFPASDCGDVWVAFLQDGTALFAALFNDDAELRIYRSETDGRTWNSPTSVGRGYDHPTLLVRHAAQGVDTTFAVGSVVRRGRTGRPRSAVSVARSVNGARSFATPSTSIVSNLSYEVQNPALLPDGSLLIPIADHRRPGDRRRLERARDWLIISADGGATFSEPMLIAETCDGSGGWSSLAVGPAAGLHPGRIYHVCTSAQFAGIQVRHSDDRGETWSDATLLGGQLRVTPYTRTPAIAVNRAGVVVVAWYDARNDPSTIKGALRCQEIMVAASGDGGSTFSTETRLSSQRSCPAAPRNIETALRFPAGGEYIGLAPLPDGSFILLWSDARTGVYQLRTATVSVK